VRPPGLLLFQLGASSFDRPVSARRAGVWCALDRQPERFIRQLLVLGLLAISGCAGRDTILLGGASVGQLKTTVSHLQFENEQLKTEVAKLKDEQRTIEDRLVQVQIHNGDLAARLDDARNLLRDRGVDADTRLGTRSRGSRAIDTDGEGSQARTLPARRTTRKPRKPPAASIRSDLDDLPTALDEGDEDSPTISLNSSDYGSPRRTFPDDTASPSFNDDHLRWRPVATGTDVQATPRR
jgi:hypothetical protein